MNRRKIALLFLVVVLSSLMALPAFAFEYKHHCGGGGVTWWHNFLTINVPRDKFNTPDWVSSLELARSGWNIHAPGSYWGVTYNWVDTVRGVPLDGSNDITISRPEHWRWGGWAAVTQHQYSCSDYIYGPGKYSEVDTVLHPDANNWDKSTNPIPSDYMQNSTLVLLHEHGHILGLGHEDDVLATMNSGWPGPVGGPIGNHNDVHPLGDDARGARNAYGTRNTVRDVAASAVRLVSPGVSRTIVAPATAYRGSNVSFYFTILNRGTTDQTFPVHFYLSPTRNVHPSTGIYLGTTTISLLYARMTTGLATVRIPDSAPAGYHYLGWFADPGNAISEFNEINNGVALVSPTYISANNLPNACFWATPVSGDAPLTVTVNASCSSDPDGGTLTYAWDFGDYSTDSGPSSSHTYYTGGYFYITLTVTDAQGASSTATQKIAVYCPPDKIWCQEPE